MVLSGRNAIWSTVVPFVALTVLLLSAPAGVRADTPAPDPLLVLNASFRKAHADARKEMLAKNGPVVLLEGDDLILLRDGKRTAVRVIPDIYHTLKDIGHAIVGIHLLLTPYGEGEIGIDRLDALKEFRKQLALAEKGLDGRGLSDEQRQRSRKMLTSGGEFIDIVSKTKKASSKDVLAFTRAMGPLVSAHASDAAQAQLDAMHRRMTTWRSELTPQEWKTLRVVIIGSPMPRKGNLAVRSFARLLGEKGEGLRIIYAESLFDEAKAMNLLGVSLVDSGIAVVFFDDDLRMHIDLLSPMAEEYIKTMKFEP